MVTVIVRKDKDSFIIMILVHIFDDFFLHVLQNHNHK